MFKYSDFLDTHAYVLCTYLFVCKTVGNLRGGAPYPYEGLASAT